MQQTFSNNNSINNIVISFTDYLQVHSFLTSQRRVFLTCKTLSSPSYIDLPQMGFFVIYTWHYSAALPFCTLEKKKKVVKCMLQEMTRLQVKGRSSRPEII